MKSPAKLQASPGLGDLRLPQVRIKTWSQFWYCHWVAL